MADWFEHDMECNTLTLTSLPGRELDYDDALIMFEELEDRLADMEARQQQIEVEVEQEYRETESFLERFWRE